MQHRIGLSFVVAGIAAAAIGCASVPSQREVASAGADARAWPLGNDQQMRATSGAGFGPSGHVRFSSTSPVYVTFLELRPTLDSLDVRLPGGVDSLEAVVGTTELLTAMETVDPLRRLTASDQATNCSNVKLGAGDPVGQNVCPVSRGYGGEPARTWNFKNRVFLLVTDRPLVAPLTRAIPWRALRTTPPVAAGSKWTVLAL